MESHRYPEQSYIMLKRLDDAGKNTWATNVKDMLFKFGFGYEWLAQEVGNSKYLHVVCLFSQRLNACYL